MRGCSRWLALLSLVAATVAAAARLGEPLYVKAKNTRMVASPAATADTLAILQPGTKVIWRGALPGHKQWHRVELGARRGLVFQSNLSTQPPKLEIIAKDGVRAVDPVAFASSGSAVKALGDGAIAYGTGKKDERFARAVKDLQAVEAIAKSVQTAEVVAHARTAGLYPVVGPDPREARR